MRALAFDLAAEHRRAVQIRADDLVGGLGSAPNPAGNLARLLGAAADEAEHRRRRIAGLLLQLAVVDAAAVDARRGAGLQAADTKWQRPQTLGQGIGRRIAGSAAGALLQPHMNAAAQKGADGQHYRVSAEVQAHVAPHASDPAVLDDQVHAFALEQAQLGLMLQRLADRPLVEHPVALGAGGAHCWPLAGIEGAELDAGAIRGAGHGTAEGIDFLGEVALADTADGRIAGHLAQGFDVLRQQQGAAAHARAGQRRFGAGVTAANDDDFKFLHGAALAAGAANKRGGIVG